MQNSAEFYNSFRRYLVEDSKKKSLSLGMVDGPCGSILYFYNKYKIFGDKNDLSMLLAFLDNVIDVMNAPVDTTLKYSNGIAGVGWVFKHLADDGIIGKDECAAITDYLTGLLIPELASYCQNGNIDFFEGGGGVINYLIGQGPDTDDAIRMYLSTLYNTRSDSKFGTIWTNVMPTEDGTSHRLLNLGAPHGIVGIIFLLLKVKKLRNWDVGLLLNDAVEVLKGITHSKLSTDYTFPCWFDLSNDSHVPSGLAWCYGDLVTGYCLLLVAEAIYDPGLQMLAINLLSATLDRQYAVRQQTGLCHGLMSVSLLYFQIYKHTSDLRFRAAYQFWHRKAVDQLVVPLGNEAASDHRIGVSQHSSLMFGLAGSLLGMLTVEYPDTSNWQGAMLL